MNGPLSRIICENLKKLGVVRNADELSVLAGRQRNYLRSQWARNKDMSTSAYSTLYVKLEGNYQVRYANVQEMHDDDERFEEKLQLIELGLILDLVWTQIKHHAAE